MKLSSHFLSAISFAPKVLIMTVHGLLGAPVGLITDTVISQKFNYNGSIGTYAATFLAIAASAYYFNRRENRSLSLGSNNTNEPS